MMPNGLSGLLPKAELERMVAFYEQEAKQKKEKEMEVRKEICGTFFFRMFKECFSECFPCGFFVIRNVFHGMCTFHHIPPSSAIASSNISFVKIL